MANFPKIGLLYMKEDDDPNLVERHKDIAEVFDHFSERGFKEADGTQYLLIFGPTAITPGTGIGVWQAVKFTSGAHLQFTRLRYPKEGTKASTS